METLEGLGLAANILQFCQAVGSFISQAHEIYRAGPAALGKVNDLRDISKDLHKMLSEMQRQDAQMKERHPTETSQLTLHNECLALLQDLTCSLDQLGLPENPGKRESIMIAFKTRWNRSKIEDLELRIASFRHQLVLGLLVTLRNFAMQSLDRQEAILQKLDGFGQGGGPQFRLEASSAQHSLVERSVPADSLFQHLSQVGELDKHGAKRIRAETEAKSLTSNPVEKKGTSNTTATGIILPPCRERELQDQFLAAILGSGGTNHRQSQIHEAHKQTFQWIFTESVDDDEKPAWDSFVDWLESDSQLYWMTGKAGSGKSTLMKFISHHPRLSHHLKKWSKERPVTIASFYFWASGTAMQASPEGMFRSLLHQVLDQNRHIIPKLAPQKWESACLFGKSMAWEPDPQQLHQLLGYAISEISQTSHICLLIDGLDEFNGDPDDLIDTIQEFMSNPINLKVCVSSRPWVVFEDAFYQQPQLLLQDLNRRDIEEYTESMFSTNRGFKRLQAREPRFARQLAKDIVEKAQGVFLWVCVVVTSLLAGMKNDDRIIDLQRRLDTLPPDLEDLYDAIVKSWDPFYFQHAAQYFKLLEATGPGCDARIFFLVDIEDLISYAIELNQEPLPVPEYAFQVETVKRRLNSRCLGLLEVRTSTIRMDDDDMPDTVEYLHRTVKDYVTKPEVQTRFQAATKSLDPYLHLCAAHLAAAKSPCFLSGPWNSKSDTLIIGHCYNALKFASKMAKANTSAMVCLVDEVARVLDNEEIPYSKVDANFLVGTIENSSNNKCLGPVGTSFLSLVTRMNVIGYIKARAYRSRAILSPLLLDSAHSHLSDVDTFRSLLELGADYNSEVEPPLSNSPTRSTIWFEILALAISDCAFAGSHATSITEQSWRWLPILRLFLKKGAPVNSALCGLMFQRFASLMPDLEFDQLFVILSSLGKGVEQEEFEQFRELFRFNEELPAKFEYDTDATDD